MARPVRIDGVYLVEAGQDESATGQLITTQLAKSGVDPYEGMAPCAAEVDLQRLRRALELPFKLVRESLLPDGLQGASVEHFRYCSKCLCRGYHSIVHQIGFTQCSPIHGDPLEVACRACGAKAPYRLNVAPLDAPYRCGGCRHLHGTAPPASLPHKRPLNKKARIAVTRMWFTQCSHF
jgi:hypothetical protein